ncbi:isopeptide-forming domain-containing fimbrial protein [Carnobacterium maltaromaticum]|uniref:isopeptide-forming domain-containing fimbrial protein n=1 Tax=Carnobacterium maltaromaticum TaxID=2751 RepID=UPI00295F3ADF|nr:isopeptide-forming domain-containing fimbrial protein [Carnobacterium maltaromaticum]
MRIIKKRIAMWISVFFFIGLILSGLYYITQYKYLGIKADELDLKISSNQQEFYEKEEFQFDIIIPDSLNNHEFYLEVPTEFELNIAQILQVNQGMIEKIDPIGTKQKITLVNDRDVDITLHISGNLTKAGDFKVTIVDGVGVKTQFPIIVKAHPSIETLTDTEKNIGTVDTEKIETGQPLVTENPIEEITGNTSPLNLVQPRLNLLPKGNLLVNEPGIIEIPKNNPPQTISGEYGMIITRFKESTVNYFIHGVDKGKPASLQRFTLAQSGEDTYIYYTKAGFYKGRMIDVKEVIVKTSTNGSYFGTDTPVPNGNNNMLSAWVAGGPSYNPATIRIEFYDSETGEKVKVKGVWNLSDTDNKESVIMYSDFIQEVYVREDSDLLGTLTSGRLTIESPVDTNIADSDEKRWVSVTYGETDELTFDYYSSSSWNGYDVKSLVPIDFPAPTKIGTVENQATKKINYKTYVTVPYRQLKNFEPQLIIEDSIIDELAVESYNVIDALTGQNVNNLFTLSQQGNKIRAEAKATSLERADFYNKMYMLEVAATVKLGANLSKYSYENGYRLLPNTSQIVVTNIDVSDKIIKSNEAFAHLKDETNSTLTQEVFHEDGKKADTATIGDMLIYRATVFPEGKDPNLVYMSANFISESDKQLENIENIVIKNSKGEVLASGSYDESLNKVVANLKGIARVDDGLYLEYSGTVKMNLSPGAIILGRTSFSKTNNTGSTTTEIMSNTVRTQIVKKREILEQVLDSSGNDAKEATTGDILHYSATFKGEEPEGAEGKKSSMKTKSLVKAPSQVYILYLDEKNTVIPGAPTVVLNGQIGELVDSSLKGPLVIPGYVYTGVVTWSENTGEIEGDSVTNFLPWIQRLSYKYRKFVGPIKYKKLEFKHPLDKSLEIPTNIVLKTKTGKIVGDGHYNEVDQVVEASLTDTEVLGSEDVQLEFDAKVKSDVLADTLITGQATAEGSYNNDVVLNKAISNEVQTIIKLKEGTLDFISAPKNLNYGENLKITTKDKIYPIQVKDDALIVKDSRKIGSEWSMRATLLEDLVSESDATHKLMNALHYYYKNQDYTLSVGNAIPIMDKKTVDSQPVDISSDWESIDQGPVLDIRAGKPYSGSYTASIQWTLQDVPTNGGGSK